MTGVNQFFNKTFYRHIKCKQLVDDLFNFKQKIKVTDISNNTVKKKEELSIRNLIQSFSAQKVEKAMVRFTKWERQCIVISNPISE